MSTGSQQWEKYLALPGLIPGWKMVGGFKWLIYKEKILDVVGI
jgi:hypothetical protein